MLKSLTRLLAVALALGAVLAGTSSPVPLAPSPSAAAVGDCVQGSNWGTPRQDLTARVLELVNQHRTAMGLVALKTSRRSPTPRSGRPATWPSTTTSTTPTPRRRWPVAWATVSPPADTPPRPRAGARTSPAATRRPTP